MKKEKNSLERDAQKILQNLKKKKKKTKKGSLETDAQNTTISFQLNNKQQKMFDTWKGHLKALYGECGSLTWKITPTGIGSAISVYSDLAKIEFDLTDVDSW
jgi:hypothetical protein